MKLNITHPSISNATSGPARAMTALHEHLGRLLAWPFNIGDDKQVRPLFQYLADLHGSGDARYIKEKYVRLGTDFRAAKSNTPTRDAGEILRDWPGADDAQFVEHVRGALGVQPSLARRWIDDVEETAWAIYTAHAESTPRSLHTNAHTG